MIDYREYEPEDFLADESFRQWVLGASKPETNFWEQWLQNNPDRADTIRQAQGLVRTLVDHYQDDATNERIDRELDRLMKRAVDRRDTAPVPAIIPLKQAFLWRWVAAASVTLLLGLSTYQYLRNNQTTAVNNYEQAVSLAPKPLREKVNQTDQPVNVLLSDGSLVTLSKNSRLSYPQRFDGKTRAVYLSGEAFFDVAKNPAKPFLIYANTTVTKVLGTSFLVRAYQSDPNVTVVVKTGRVQVYAQKDYNLTAQKGALPARNVVLLPAQQMTYQLEEDRLIKAVASKPVTLAAAPLNNRLSFADTPVTEVFSALERVYSVKMMYPKEALTACRVTLTFTDESLAERLEVICQLIGASYEVVDEQVFIRSKGC